MRTSQALGPWLAVAVAAHLAVGCTAALAEIPQAVQFYGIILAYAAPAAVGLAAAGRLTPGRALAFAALVVVANGLAVTATLAAAPRLDDPIWKIVQTGALGGLVGAALSLFGLIALSGARPSARMLLAAAGGSAILSALGGGLCLAAVADSLPLSKALALPVVLYLPWQVVFSPVVAWLSSPRDGSS